MGSTNNAKDFSNAPLQANAQLLAKKGWLVAEWSNLAPSSDGFGPAQFEALTMCANFESFGAKVEPETARTLSWQSIDTLRDVYFIAEKAIRESSGAHRDFAPMYPNFPQQVIAADEATLLRNALAHYGSVAAGCRELPEYKAIEREAEELAKKPLNFQIIDEAKALSYLGSIAKANSSMSPSDREALEWIAKAFAHQGMADLAAEAIQGGDNKENLAACAQASREIGSFAKFAEKLRICTDALRVACAFSDGDASLASSTKFKNFTRPERRAMLGIVERHIAEGDSEQAMENLFSKREAWLRLGERLHPGEMKKNFPLAAMAFEDLRSGKSPRPYADKIKEALESKDTSASLKLLRSRPGEFCRRVGAASRALGPAAHDALAKAFDGCSDKVSTPVLVQAMASFEHAAQDKPGSRAFMPKGGMGRIYLQQDSAEKAMDPAFAQTMANHCERALTQRFAQFAPLGNVYVDPALDKVNTPFAARSASRQTKSLSRGSRVAVDGKIARLFTWWGESGPSKVGAKMACGRIDIDLSCLFLGADYKPMGHVSWTMLRDGSAVVHSGDITSAPNGACEFIDVDYAKLDPNIKYVAMTIHAFTGQNFSDMPECFAGWMGRETGMKGKYFDARAVQGKSDVAMAASSCMPLFLDVDAKEAVWADLALPKNSGYSMVEKQSKTIAMAVQALAEMKKPTFGRLARLHASARGQLVDDPAKADVVFAMAQGVTPYDFELVASELLADAPPSDPQIKRPEPPATAIDPMAVEQSVLAEPEKSGPKP